jgi:virginiamycin B lyase
MQFAKAAALAGALLTSLVLPATGMAATGQITQFPVPTANSGPFGITGGPDGNVWFTEKAVPKLGKITPTGAVTEFPTGGTAPYDIVTGPDNNLWMTDQGGNKLYKISNLGAATPTITAQAVVLASPTGLAVGPDNDLWVLQQAGSVQRVKLDGTADGSAIPTGGTNLNSIAKNADGSLMWVTDLNDGPAMNNGLIKVTTGATKTATAVTIGANKGPRGVAVGPDGKMYFAESGGAGKKIGRVNADGSGFQETALLNGITDPEGTAFGRDGNLYVAVFNGSQIAQVSQTLGLNQFSTGITTNAGPREIAKGADGNMWFTLEGEPMGGTPHGAIGRITVDAPTTNTGGGSSSSGGGSSSTGGGSTTGGGGGGTTGNTSAPQVSSVSASPSRFRVGPQATAVSAAATATGTTFKYMLTKDARVTLTIEQALPGRAKGRSCAKPSRTNRKGKKCTRYAKKGALTRTGQSGQNEVAFSGRIGSKALKPGHYRVGIAGTDSAGQTSAVQYGRFTVLANKKVVRHKKK